MRAFLRLEFLFEQAAFRLSGDSIWDSRSALDAILDIIALLGRADLRTELIKELERHLSTFETLSNNPGVDPARLDQVLGRIRPMITTLRSTESSNLGQDLRSNELLTCVRQRSSIPAGTCSFDIPSYQNWLEQPASVRLQQLSEWLGAFDLFNRAITLCLELVRSSAASTHEVATKGFFQRSLDSSVSCQLIRVIFPVQQGYYPEISGGRHRFSIRFLRQQVAVDRPVQSDRDVEFDLQCCMI
jgi:cell division protein ZapD